MPLIERRDSAALRRMAEETRKQETRMFLALLAENARPPAAEKHSVEEDSLSGGQPRGSVHRRQFHGLSL